MMDIWLACAVKMLMLSCIAAIFSIMLPCTPGRWNNVGNGLMIGAAIFSLPAACVIIARLMILMGLYG